MALVCRICLIGNIRMLDVDNIHLLDMYETLTNTKLNTETEYGMPSKVCYVCHRELQKCHKLSQMANISNGILQDLFQCGIEATHHTVTKMPLEIKEKLSVTPTQYMHISDYPHTGSTPILTVKEELDRIVVTKEETYNTQDIEEFLEDTELGNDLNNSELPSDNEIYAENKTIDIHTEEKPYTCNRCDKAFWEKSNLKRHMLIHTEEKLYTCNRCDKTFNQKSYLKRHMQIHTTSIEKLFSCNRCDKAFWVKSNLKRHMLIHTGEKPYSCNRCDKAFNQKGTLKDHMRIHTGEKPHSCNICDKAFNHKLSLKIHMLIHSGEKPYSCNSCDKAFNQNSTLKKHMLIHTGEKSYSCNIPM